MRAITARSIRALPSARRSDSPRREIERRLELGDDVEESLSIAVIVVVSVPSS
jgi:hypothetical protein